MIPVTFVKSDRPNKEDLLLYFPAFIDPSNGASYYIVSDDADPNLYHVGAQTPFTFLIVKTVQAVSTLSNLVSVNLNPLSFPDAPSCDKLFPLFRQLAAFPIEITLYDDTPNRLNIVSHNIPEYYFSITSVFNPNPLRINAGTIIRMFLAQPHSNWPVNIVKNILRQHGLAI